MKYKVGDVVESDPFGIEHRPVVITYAGLLKGRNLKIYRYSYITCDTQKIKSTDILASLFESYSTRITN